MLAIDSTIKLAGGGLLPRLGYGVYQARDVACENGVAEALKIGYKHIDSAQAYKNEDRVAAAVSASTVDRKSLFLTTKYMPTHKVHPSSNVLEYVKKSSKKFDMGNGEEGYIDLMLIHAPFGGEEGRANNWKALADAQKEGWVKDIGVSNFGVKHLEALPSPIPAVNQIELHPFCQQKEIVKYCHDHGIVVEAYSPLVRASKEHLDHPAIQAMCKKHAKGETQILLRWSLQKGYVPLPKSVTPSRILSNSQVYDFELSTEDMASLDALDRGAAGAVTWNPVESD